MSGDPFELAFTPAEFQRRLQEVRRGMRDRALDLLLVFSPENVSYITGYETIGYSSFLCLLVPLEGAPRMVVREMELDVAHATTWLTEFATVSDGEDPVQVASGVVSEIAGAGDAVGVEETSVFLPPRTWRAVVDAVARFGARPVDGSGLVEPVRRIKSDEELSLIRSACDLAVAGMAAAVEAVNAGATENEVASVAFTAMVDGGSDFLSGGPIVTSGARGSIAHTTFGNRTIVDGDPVLIELGACRRRYGGALM
ncbi:MAG: Xaa-Pro dipeptidase, partial [Mucilaginibacter sp.]|nr:Xaa-Pro dipeptidase [Mucilaginibacter sp.]